MVSDSCNPHPDVIRRYRELGGEIITIGADAHRPEHIAYDFEKAGRDTYKAVVLNIIQNLRGGNRFLRQSFHKNRIIWI